MRDVDVRRALHRDLYRLHGTDSLTRILDEFGVCQGMRRIDVAVVNGELTGFEIKSERDRLDRLPEQRDIYSRVFDRVYLVAAACHMDRATALLPEWWGLTVVQPTGHHMALHSLRAASLNDGQQPYALAQLLWRDEALKLLDQLGMLDAQLRRGSRRHMWQALAGALKLEDLAKAVREALKTRKGWRDHD